MKRFVLLGAGLLLLALISGCSPYVEDYYFVPHPVRADIPATQPDQPPPVSALVSVVGVHRADTNEGIPESVEVRFRLENTAAQVVQFSPQSLELTDGAFVNFPAPILRPPQAWALPQGAVAILTAYFPFPPGRSWGNTDLQSLQLRWSEQIDGRPVRQVALFNRVYTQYYYYDPYWGYPGPYGYYGVGVGFGFHHRH